MLFEIIFYLHSVKYSIHFHIHWNNVYWQIYCRTRWNTSYHTNFHNSLNTNWSTYSIFNWNLLATQYGRNKPYNVPNNGFTVSVIRWAYKIKKNDSISSSSDVSTTRIFEQLHHSLYKQKLDYAKQTSSIVRN